MNNTFKTLGSHIKQTSPERSFKTLTIASLIQNHAHDLVPAGLAAEYASENLDTLLIETDWSHDKNETSSPSGFLELYKKFFELDLNQGHVQDYGLIDLLGLFYLQSKTGELVILTANNEKYTLTICNGMVSAIQTPLIDSANNLKPFEAQTSQLSKLIKTKSKKILLVNSLIRSKLLPLKDIKDRYAHELSKLLNELKNLDLTHFEFNTLGNKDYLKLAELIPHPIFYNDEFEDQNYIVNTIQKCTVKTLGNYYSLGIDNKSFSNIKNHSQYVFLDRVLTVLQKVFDRIIFHAPEIEKNPNSQKIVKLTQATLLVIKRDSPERNVKKVVNKLTANNVNVIGSVFYN